MSRGQAVDGRMRAERLISVILAMSSFLTVTFQAYRGKETSKKIIIRFKKGLSESYQQDLT